MNGHTPSHPPPPYTTANGHYPMVANGFHPVRTVENSAYDTVPPPLPERNSTHIDLGPDPILPYSEIGTYATIGASDSDSIPDKSEGQSSHRVETANPLYASAEDLEPVYSKLTDVGSEEGSVADKETSTNQLHQS